MILERYLRKVPGARPHMPVGPHAPMADLVAIASHYPVFLVVPRTTRTQGACVPAGRGPTRPKESVR